METVLLILVAIPILLFLLWFFWMSLGPIFTAEPKETAKTERQPVPTSVKTERTAVLVEDSIGDARTRAVDALRAGKVGTALAIFAETENRKPLFDTMDLLTSGLPEGPLRSVLPAVADQLLELNRIGQIARAAGAPEEVTGALRRNADLASQLLWERVDRIAAATAMIDPQWEDRSKDVAIAWLYGSYAKNPIDSAQGWAAFPDLQADLEKESEKFDRLLSSISEAKVNLAELILSGGEGRAAIERVQMSFRNLAETAKAIQDEELA